MKQVKVDVSKCTGCGQCALTCAFRNSETFDLKQSDIRIVQWESICLSVPILCPQCQDVPCITACPTEALSFHAATGAIQLDTNLCSQCYECEQACPYQVIFITVEGYPHICDLCGGDPQCVRVCYPGSLSFEEIPEEGKEPLRNIVQELVERSNGKNVQAPAILRERSVT